MNVLVLGSGGREHALCETLARSKKLSKLWCAPGNPGIAEVAECLPMSATDVDSLAEFARSSHVDLVIPGPEASICAGISAKMTHLGIPCFAPTTDAALLETSKLFAKNICRMAGVPTAASVYFNDAAFAHESLLWREKWPCVIKADGLASGKGVFIAHDIDEANQAISALMRDRIFGAAGDGVLIEDFLEGEEVSFFVLCHGDKVVPFGAAQDHKRIGDGDTGPNTGGMGAYSPPPKFTPEMQERVLETIIRPVIGWLVENEMFFQGVLFAGLMLTEDGPKLIEFNVRFGDPECQTLLMRLDSDLLDIIHNMSCGRIDDIDLRWKEQCTLTVVMASPGYPDCPRTGSPISIGELPDGVKVFQAGTAVEDGRLVSAGGRVLNVCAVAKTLKEAQDLAYLGVESVQWKDSQYRHDIGWRAITK